MKNMLSSGCKPGVGPSREIHLHSAPQQASRQSPLYSASAPFTWVSGVILCSKQQTFAISLICVCSLAGRVACGTAEQTARAFGRSAHSTASDWKDGKWCENSCGPLLLQTHLKESHADKPQMHTGGTGNSYCRLQITRVSMKAETSGSFQERENERER